MRRATHPRHLPSREGRRAFLYFFLPSLEGRGWGWVGLPYYATPTNARP
ncbi:MAG: hypothetical protein ACJAWY_001439 [Sphingomonas echinoides]|jgi:hypothetical protein